MAICNVKHPIKDTVKADNSTYSSNKIESLVQSAMDLPAVTAEDAGDVLMVNDEGEWAKGEIVIPQELPTVTSEDAGDVLMVNAEGAWAKGEIPAPESDIFLITLTDNSGSYSSDKTAAEIHAAVFAGKTIKLNIPISSQRAIVNVDFIQIVVANVAYKMIGGYLDPSATPMAYRYFTLTGIASSVQIAYDEKST